MSDPLSLWNETPTRQAILDFVAAATTPGRPDLVPAAERIATFDNDGTLWCEKPAYIQLFFALRRLKEQAAADPALLEQPGYKATAAGDLAYFDSLYPGNLSYFANPAWLTRSAMALASRSTSSCTSAASPFWPAGMPMAICTCCGTARRASTDRCSCSSVTMIANVNTLTMPALRRCNNWPRCATGR